MRESWVEKVETDKRKKEERIVREEKFMVWRGAK